MKLTEFETHIKRERLIDWINQIDEVGLDELIEEYLQIMKKVIAVYALIALSSCSYNPKPIEKYKGKGYVITKIQEDFTRNKVLQLKNIDNIISVTILPFDAKNLKVGDSLK